MGDKLEESWLSLHEEGKQLRHVIGIQEKRINELEQQLKTAKADGVREYLDGQIRSKDLSKMLVNKKPLI